MKRRQFIKSVGTAGLFTFITPTGIVQALGNATASNLETDFLRPPASARAHTWWHWMNGHITKDGITRDLEAMKRVGIGGFQNFFVGTGIPKGPVEYLSAEWLELMKHTIKEADRLGLEFQMHNCPGWSSSGGPWITPELSMQQVVWSETFVKGGRSIQMRLPQPFKRANFYKDTYVIAFPSVADHQKPWHEQLVRVTGNGTAFNKELFINEGGKVEIQPVSETQPGQITFEFSAPLTAQSILLYGTSITEPTGGGVQSIAPVTLEASDDGTIFRNVAVIRQIGGETPGSGSFPLTTAKCFRLLFPRACRIYQVSFSGAARITDWTAKANYSGANPGQQMLSVASTTHIPAGSVIDASSVVDITKYMDKDGGLNWQAPEGEWTIMRFGHTSTGRINKAAPTTGEGLEVDKYSKEAFDYHFYKMLDSLLPALKPLAQKGKVGVLIDSYEVGMQNWTKNFPQEFKNRRGYEIIKYLPAMTGLVVSNVEKTEGFLWDVRRVQADLMADHYYGRCTELCRKHKMISYTEPYNGGPLEQMQVGSRMDINMGEFWIRTLHFHHSLKLASSIQHINGRKVVGAEAFTGYALYSKWQEHPYSMKAHGDYMFTKGLNRMIFHRYAHQPHPTAVPGMTMGPWGFHFDRTNTWWNQGRAWLTYLARCQYLLQQGLFVADLLYFTGEDAPGADLSLQAEPTPAPPKGYDFDYINAEVLLHKLRVDKNRIALPDGMSYKVMVLPQSNTMSLPILRKIHELVQQGMVLVGERPAKMAGLGGTPNRDAAFKRLADELWESGNGQGEKERTFGRGRVFTDTPLKAVLDGLRVQPDFNCTSRSSDAVINYIHRRVGDAEIYFIANMKRRPEELVCSFRINDRKPELWNADTGEIIPVGVYETSNGRVQVPLRLDPAGSMFVVFRSKATSSPRIAVEADGVSIFSTKPFPVSQPGRYAPVVNNFTLSAWIKPDCDIALPNEPDHESMLRRFGPKSFVFYPLAGDVLYGSGHAIAGVNGGRNGVAVYEHTSAGMSHVLVYQGPLSGWTHVALQYRDGTPALYINGKRVGEGNRSAHKVHPGVGDEYYDQSASYFEGEVREVQVWTETMATEQIATMASSFIPRMEKMPAVDFAGKANPEMLFWQNGQYSVKDSTGKKETITIKGINEPYVMNGPWQVSFPPNLGAPGAITLASLQSLSKHDHPGVKYFSGTATYRKDFTIPTPEGGKRLFLDLGQVDVIAEVTVNGKDLGILWKPPFRVDITDVVKTGTNSLEVKVTNLWTNRLIGDEQMPEEHNYNSTAFGQKGGIEAIPDWYVKGAPKPPSSRITFATWKHYNKDSPVVESGLIGPVVIRTAVKISIAENIGKV